MKGENDDESYWPSRFKQIRAKISNMAGKEKLISLLKENKFNVFVIFVSAVMIICIVVTYLTKYVSKELYYATEMRLMPFVAFGIMIFLPMALINLILLVLKLMRGRWLSALITACVMVISTFTTYVALLTGIMTV